MAQKKEQAVEVSVRIAARRSTVAEFLARPELFEKWMGVGSRIEPLTGGEVIVRLHGGDVALGRVVEIVPERRIVFTWGHQDGKYGLAPGATGVTIELADADGGTLVTLRHEGLPDDSMRHGMTMGWRHYLSLLAVSAADHQFGGAIGPLIASYVAAWNETDPHRRMELLNACWRESGVYRDRMGAIEGKSNLNEHIATSQQFAPGLRLELAGPADQCQGAVRFPWRIVDPNRKVVFTGACFGTLDADGKLAAVVGFWDAPA